MSIADKLTQVAENIPKVYAAGQSSMVDQSKLIPKTVSGSYISVDDVSEIPHSVGCKVESVNLWSNKNSYVIQGTGVSKVFEPIYERFDETVVFSCVVDLEEVEYSQVGNFVYFWVTYEDGTSGPKRIVGATTTSGLVAVSFVTLEASKDNPISSIHLNVHARFTSGTVTLSNIMLNRGTTALPYTPHVEPETVQVTRCRRNLLNPDNFSGGELVEYNGVQCYKYIDNGTNFTYSGVFKENTQYTISFKVFSTASQAHITVIYTDGTSYKIYAQNEKEYVSTSAAGKTIKCIRGAHNFGKPVYIDLSFTQLNEGTTALPYEPYNGQTLTPAADGTVEGMTSVSPYMNVFSDTAGVNIEATYNKSYGMQTEYDRFWDEFQQNGKRTTYYYGFLYWYDNAFKPKYPLKPKYAVSMFQESKISGDMTERAEIDFSEAKSVMNAFMYSSLITRLGVLDFRAVTENHISVVAYCSALETIDEIILKDDGTQFHNATNWSFTQCNNLKNIKITGEIPFNTNFQYSPLTKASITSVINALYEGSTGKTLTLKLSAVNTAFETSSGAGDGSTSAEFAALVATKTNWTITMI